MNLYVGNLSFDTDENALRQFFADYGPVTSVRIITDRDTGRSRGFGFVTFADEDSAHKAVAALNESQLDGRTIRVDVAQERSRDRDGGGRGRRDRW